MHVYAAVDRYFSETEEKSILDFDRKQKLMQDKYVVNYTSSEIFLAYSKRTDFN